MGLRTGLVGTTGGGSGSGGGGTGPGLPPVGTAGNLLTSNGTAWVSQSPPLVGMRYMGTVATATALPTTGNQNGDVYYSIDNGHAHIWHAASSTWNDVGGTTGGGVPLPAAGPAGNVLTSTTSGGATVWASAADHWVEDTGDDVTAASGKQWKYTGGGTATPTNSFKAGAGRTGTVTEWQSPAGAVVASVDAAGTGTFGSAKFWGKGTVVNAGGAIPDTSTGTHNTAVGFAALRVITTGVNNTAVGERAMVANTSGIDNVAVGNYALSGNTTGKLNTGIGKHALLSNATGYENVAIGALSLRNSTHSIRNVAIGVSALQNTSTGAENVAVGPSASGMNTTGSRNTTVGAFASNDNVSGDENTAVGSDAASVSTNGGQNTAVGFSSGLVDPKDHNFVVGATYRARGSDLMLDGASVTSPHTWVATRPDHAVGSTGALVVGVESVSNTVQVGAWSVASHDNSVAIGANAHADAVRSVQIGDNTKTYTKVGVGDDRLIPLAELKTLVAGATNWHDFQTAIGGLT